jgi:hypothetical protein
MSTKEQEPIGPRELRTFILNVLKAHRVSTYGRHESLKSRQHVNCGGTVQNGSAAGCSRAGRPDSGSSMDRGNNLEGHQRRVIATRAL